MMLLLSMLKIKFTEYYFPTFDRKPYSNYLKRERSLGMLGLFTALFIEFYATFLVFKF